MQISPNQKSVRISPSDLLHGSFTIEIDEALPIIIERIHLTRILLKFKEPKEEN
jgi:hypothetical protein